MSAAQQAYQRDRALSRALVLLIERSEDLTRVAQESLGREGVANADIRILMAISAQPGVKPSELAKQLRLSRSMISHALERFQKTGLVVRAHDSLDRRVVRIALSSLGRRSVAAFQSRLGAYLVESLPQTRELVKLLGTDDIEDSQLAFATPLQAAAILSSAGEGYRVDVTAQLRQYGIDHSADRFALSLIHDQGPLRPATLAKNLGLTTGGTSALLDRLERGGLVERQNRPDLGDRRTVLVSITPLGREAARIALHTLERHAPALATALLASVFVGTSAGAA